MTRDDKLLEISCKEMLMNIVKESESLNNKLTFFQKTLLYDKIREMSLNEVLSILYEQNPDETGGSKALKYGAAAAGGFYGGKVAAGKGVKILGRQIIKPRYKSFKFAGGGITGAAAGMGLLFLFRKMADPCVRKHIGNPEARLECHVAATRRVIDQIRNNMQDCYNAENPMECRNRLHRQMLMWQNKLSEYTGALERSRR